MTAPLSHGGGRHCLTFSLNGLSSRDETLFKSFVRLLAHRTLQQWTFTPQGGDVCVAAQDAACNLPAEQKILVVGPAHHGEAHFVSTPFHADALEQVLNDLGSSVTTERHTGTTTLAADRPVAQFKLLRWPPSGLLTSTDHMRLATMMTGKWTTLATLHERSGVPMQVCSQFMADLQHAGLLADVSHATHAAPLPAHGASSIKVPGPARNVEPGLISRIRSRLGLFSAGRT